MKNFWKAFVLIIIASTLFLSGCNIVQINSGKYYERVVATVNGAEITKKDLINMYQNYGYQYVNYYSYTTEEAIEESLDYIVKRKLIAEYVKDTLEADAKELTITQKNEIWNSVFKYVNDYVLNIENTIRKELSMDEVSNDEEEETSDYKPEEVYEKKVERVVESGVESYRVIVTNDDTDTVLLTKADFAQTIHGDATISAQAWARYMKILIKAEDGKGLDTIEANVFNRELDRLYTIYEEDEYVNLLEKTYNNTFPVDTEAVVNRYVELAMASYSKYAELGDEAGYTQYVKDMQADPSTVYWHPYGEKFTSVAHVLLKFTDAQLETLADIKKQKTDGYLDEASYNLAVENWKANLLIKARDADGNETGEGKTVQQIYDEISAALTACGSDLQARAEAFNTFIYKYGQDSGMLNAKNYYVVNLDTEVTDNMVTAFADESRRLYNEEGDGSLSQPIFVDNTGASNAYAGFHIIFNVGGVDNEMVSDINNLNNLTAQELYETRIMIGTTKTYFDAMYDLVYSSNYSNRQTSLVNQLKADATIVYYKNAYKDLF